MSSSSSLNVQSLPGAHFGAEITGLDPSNITAADREVMWDTYRNKHGLICFSFDELSMS